VLTYRAFTPTHPNFARLRSYALSVEDAALVGGDHVLDVDEGVFATVGLEHLEGLLDQVTQDELLALRVLDLVSNVHIVLLEQVHDWEDLTVVWDESLTDGVGASNQDLQDLEGDGDDLWVTGVQRGLDWDDELWDDWEHLGATLLQHVEASLDREETVRVLLLADTFEEDWQVVMVVQLHNVDLPEDLVWWSVLDGDWQVSAIVETSEL